MERKTLKKIGRESIKVCTVIIILIGLFISTKELIVNGMNLGEQVSYNFLKGAVLFFGGLCIGFMIVLTEEEEEVKRLKKLIKR